MPKYLKIIFKALISIILAVILVYIAVISGILDNQIKKYLEYSFKRQGVDLSIGNFSIDYENIEIQKTSLKLSANKTLKIDSIKINRQFSYKKIWDISYKLILSTRNLEILDKKNILVSSKEIKSVYNYDLRKLNLNVDLSANNIKHYFNNNYSNSKIQCRSHKHFGSDHTANCSILIDGKNALEARVESRDDRMILELNSKKIPLQIYQFVRPFFITNKIFLLLDEHIKSGQIDQGYMNLILTEDNNFEKLKAEFDLSGVEYSYDKTLPRVTNAKGKLTINNAQINVDVTDALIAGKTKIKGVININLANNEKDLKFHIKAQAKGKAANLTQFVPKDVMDETRNIGIDINSAAADAETKIDISIFPFMASSNEYDISSKLKDFSWSIFDNKIFIKSKEIYASFDWNNLIIKGQGLVNNYPSQMEYNLQLSNGEQNIDISAQLQQISKQDIEKNPEDIIAKLIYINDGKARLDFNYKSKEDKASMLIKSDMTQLDYEIHRSSIESKKNQDSHLSIDGKFLKNSSDISLSLEGDDGLDIKASFHKYPKLANMLKINKFEYKDRYSFWGNMSLGIDLIDINFHGKNIDLSELDLINIEFSDPSAPAPATKNIDINFDKVIMKNNVEFDDFTLHLDCRDHKCYFGHMQSQIGDKYLKMLMSRYDNKENWILNCSDAGSLFSGIGLSNKIKSGNLYLLFDVYNNSTITGDKIGIEDGLEIKGEFYIDRFIIIKTPFLSKFLSITSLPGLFSFFSNKNQIPFKNFYGDFSMENDILKLTKGTAIGPFMNISMDATIDQNKRNIKVSGMLYPPVYYINNILSKMPIINKFVSAGPRKGVISAPFTISEKY